MLKYRRMGTSYLGELDDGTKCEVFQAMGISEEKSISSNYTEFFNFFLETYLFDFKESGNSFLKERSYGDIISAIGILREGFDSQTKTQVRQRLMEVLQLQSRPPEPEIDKMLEQSAKIYTFVDAKEWKSDETIQCYIERTFSPCIGTIDGPETRFPSSFNLRNLSHIAGIKTQWTYDLSRHLLSFDDEDDAVVYIFHLASMLDLYERSQRIPRALRNIAKETLETHLLLLPSHNTRVRSWVKAQKKIRYQHGGRTVDILHSGFPRYLRSSERHMNRFPIWRERLLTLKDIYDEREPRGILRFWRDDRKPIQWWTFWIAVLVFILAVVQCIESAVQTYKAYH